VSSSTRTLAGVAILATVVAAVVALGGILVYRS
jgi:hypothetical protein